MNFLQETIDTLKELGYTPDDIILIADSETGDTCTWEEFKAMADFDYDNEYGWHGVIASLRIYLNDHSILMRTEYEGIKWWEHIKIELPKPTGTKIATVKE